MSVEIFPQDPVPEPDIGGAGNRGWRGPGGIGPAGRDLWRRVLFTLGALAAYRLGSYIPLLGIDVAILPEIVSQRFGPVITMFDVFVGGALGRTSIFAFGILPYVSAIIILQCMQAVSPQLGALKMEGAAGRIRINQYTRYLALLLCALQAYGVAAGLEGMREPVGAVVADPGPIFRGSLIITLVAGTAFLIWLAEQITERGIGNGVALIVFAGVVAEIPSGLSGMLALGRGGVLSTIVIGGVLAVVLVAAMLIVFVQRGQRRIIVHYPKRHIGGRFHEGTASHIPLRLNASGAAAPVFAAAALMPLAVLMEPARPLFLLIYGALIILFSLVAGNAIVAPRELADNLRQHGAFVPGLRSGEPTADYLDLVHTRLAVVGAFYLAAVCIVPDFLMAQSGAPFGFIGAGLLIVIVVVMDSVGQAHGYLLAQSIRDGRSPPGRH